MNNVVKFNNHELNVINYQNQTWFCARDIANALEFKNPDADVCNIYRRNKSEFDDTMTRTCKLQVRGKINTVRIYNREGAWLIGMFARTSKAAEFRKWVLKVLGAVADNLTSTNKPVLVAEHKRALPSGKKEIVLSERAKQEIGGIVKSVVGAALAESNQPTLFAQEKPQTAREELKALMREVIREEIADYSLKGGIKQTPTHNGNVTADGLPVANWIVSIIHGANALDCCINQLKQRQNRAVKLLEN